MMRERERERWEEERRERKTAKQWGQLKRSEGGYGGVRSDSSMRERESKVMKGTASPHFI